MLLFFNWFNAMYYRQSPLLGMSMRQSPQPSKNSERGTHIPSEYLYMWRTVPYHITSYKEIPWESGGAGEELGLQKGRRIRQVGKEVFRVMGFYVNFPAHSLGRLAAGCLLPNITPGRPFAAGRTAVKWQGISGGPRQKNTGHVQRVLTSSFWLETGL